MGRSASLACCCCVGSVGATLLLSAAASPRQVDLESGVVAGQAPVLPRRARGCGGAGAAGGGFGGESRGTANRRAARSLGQRADFGVGVPGLVAGPGRRGLVVGGPVVEAGGHGVGGRSPGGGVV